jgi:hypothetical protein
VAAKAGQSAAEREIGRLDEAFQSGDALAQTDHAMNAAWTLWHVIDWLWESPEAGVRQRFGKIENLSEFVRGKCEALNACHDLALGGKHFLIEKKPVSKQIVADTDASVTGGEILVAGPSQLALKIDLKDGRRSRAYSILQEALAFWQEFFAENRL